jgi:GT2 family glycosyltransferase
MAGVPAVQVEFMWSLLQACQISNEYLCNPGDFIHWMKAGASYHATSRNELAANFLGGWLLFLDLDHQFFPDLIVRLVSLMEKEKVDVLSGLYRYKAAPFLPTAYDWKEDIQAYQFKADWSKEKGKQIVPVDCCGAGCLLVRRKVFDRIREELREEPFDIIHPYSEDFGFFNRLRKLKIPAYIAPEIEYFHTITLPITSEVAPQTISEVRSILDKNKEQPAT